VNCAARRPGPRPAFAHEVTQLGVRVTTRHGGEERGMLSGVARWLSDQIDPAAVQASLAGGPEWLDRLRTGEPLGSLLRMERRCKRREFDPLDNCIRHRRMPLHRWSGWMSRASQIASKANGP
jgi:hypothetical protein